MNPDFHFKTDEPNYKTPILDGYTIKLVRNQKTETETPERPISAKLYRLTDKQPDLLRSIQYIEFFPQNEKNYYQPKKITFIDHTNASEGEILIDKVTYNSGIADFIFELPK